MTERVTVTLPNEYGSELWSNEHYLSSKKNKKIRPENTVAVTVAQTFK